MFLSFGRACKEAGKNFFRNGWLSVATTSIMMLSLFVISVLLLVSVTSNAVLQNIQEKANISVYFKTTVMEDAIINTKRELEKIPEIKSIQYITSDQALADFKKNNANEQVILDSLNMIEGNPLLASLVIKANDPGQYQKIYDAINKSQFSDQFSRINYGKNKEVIERLNNVIGAVRQVGMTLGGILMAVSILITFNAIRISIYTRRQEIEVMRLVGASNAYIRLPFILEGVLYGIIATLISLLALFISVKFLAPYVSQAVPSGDLLSFYYAEFWSIFGWQILISSIIGALSGWTAMRKYMKI
jgi:cell division transport system permease protein